MLQERMSSDPPHRVQRALHGEPDCLTQRLKAVLSGLVMLSAILGAMISCVKS